VATLDRIDAWVRSRKPEDRVLWMRGMAGRGKSTIASTVANNWKTHAACAIFHFRRGQKALDNRLVCGLARQLGNGHLVPEVKDAILDSIKQNEDIGKGRLDEQFQTLLSTPLSQLEASSPPVLLIVDALDECEDANYPVEFVKLIDKHSSTLPTNVKFLLTARPEAPLLLELEPRQWNVENLESAANVDDDIEKFLLNSLSKVKETHHLREDWLAVGTIQTLVGMSQGLFQWAQTAMEYIKYGSPRRRLQELLNSPTICNGLDGLYLQILGEAFAIAKRSSDRKDIFLQVLRTLVVAPYPVSLDSLSYLFADYPMFTGSSVDDILELLRSEALSDLRSLINVPKSSTDPIQLMHTSIRDFLVDGDRCKGEPYWVDSASHHQHLALKCIQLMQRDLTTNICHLSDLSKPNIDFHVQELVQLHIPQGLQSCCRSWPLHLTGASTVAIANDLTLIRSFGYFSEKCILSWLEVMSVTRRTQEAMQAATWVYSWLQKFSDPLLIEPYALWSDMRRFIKAFYDPVEFGALHIYASALPMCPTSTYLWKHCGELARTKIVRGFGTAAWPSALWEKQCGNVVWEIAFSPDGKLLVCVTKDHWELQFWDVQTGAAVGERLGGHDSCVNAIAFTPDGKLLASASNDKTVRLWNVQRGAAVGEPLTGHDDDVLAVAFSPDGNFLASGGRDQMIRLWNVQTGAAVGEPLRGHKEPVTGISFSPDGQLLISSTCEGGFRVWDAQTGAPVGEQLIDHFRRIKALALFLGGKLVAYSKKGNSIRLWNVQTGAAVGEPLTGHDDDICAIAFSPDGNLLASGSFDKTIRLWEVQTEAAIGGNTTPRLWDARAQEAPACEPMRGHARRIRAVTSSLDGKLLASGSSDKTIRLWDAQTGAGVGQPLRGHGWPVEAIAFTPDGKLLASGSVDTAVRLWDVQTGVAVGEPLRGHYWTVNAIAFSPDGKLLASASNDKTIQLWNVQTGAPVGDQLTGHDSEVNAITFTPDGKLLASGSDDKAIRLWDVQTGAAAGEPLRGHEDGVNAVAFSPDGNLLASGSKDKSIRLWDVQARVPVGEPLIADSCFVTTVALSVDTRVLLSDTPNPLSPMPTVPNVEGFGFPVKEGSRNSIQFCQSAPLSSQCPWITYLNRRILWLPRQYWVGDEPYILLSHGRLIVTGMEDIFMIDVSGLMDWLP
ncbi:hypothetical protein FRB90_001083, partial [Tulasnella sp. 427]